ncbi:hypothetical protein PHYSODRAFT_473046, partial [Phytophthora sojae]
EVTGQGVVAAGAVVSGSEVTGHGVVAAGASVSGSEVTGQGVVAAGAVVSGSEVTGHGVVAAGAFVSGNDVTGQGVVDAGVEVTGASVSGSEVTGQGVVSFVSGKLVTGQGVELLPLQPTEGKTQPHVSPFTMVHSAFSLAVHCDPSNDGRYEWQSAVATSPTKGQAVPTGALPDPEQMAPREATIV